MRRMSFAATVDQMRDGTKTVTRRRPETWQHLAPGDRVLAIEKGMGLAKGEHQVVIGVIEIVANEVMPLEFEDWWPDYDAEAQREGFTSWAEFTDAWRRLHGHYDPSAEVRRIEFRHIEINA